jgi:hypothetical protein
MMKKTDENLSKLFDIQPITGQESDLVPISTAEDDFTFARQNIRTLAEQGQLAVNEILQVAKATQHPRAFEVAATLIKNMSDINKDLMDLQKKKNDLLPKREETIVNVDKAVFVGSTKDLIKQIKQEN